MKKECRIYEKFISCTENEKGTPIAISFKNTEKFNFAFDIVDGLARTKPDKLAMLHLSGDKTERRFTFLDMSKESSRAANYFTSLGIKKGDRVMLVLKRHYQFWFCILGLNKIGAIAIPATNQLLCHDYEYRFNSAGVSAIICTADGDWQERGMEMLRRGIRCFFGRIRKDGGFPVRKRTYADVFYFRNLRLSQKRAS